MVDRKLDLIVAGNLAQDVIYGKEYYGGCAGNIAVNASMHGLSTGIVSSYGSDDFSNRYLAYLRERGIATELLQDGLHEMPRCVVKSNVNHSSSGEWYDNGSVELLDHYSPTPTQQQKIKNAKTLHLTTVPRNLALKLVELRKGSDGILGYEPGPMVGFDNSYFDELLFGAASYIFVNEEEIEIIDNIFGINALQRNMTDKQWIINTLGDQGCRIITKRTVRNYPIAPLKGDSLVDSNGAGDAFKAGFYVSLLSNGNNVDDAINTAQRFGAAIVGQEGPHFLHRAI